MSSPIKLTPIGRLIYATPEGQSFITHQPASSVKSYAHRDGHILQTNNILVAKQMQLTSEPMQRMTLVTVLKKGTQRREF